MSPDIQNRSSRALLEAGTGFILGTMAAPLLCDLFFEIQSRLRPNLPPAPSDDELRVLCILGGLLGAGIGATIGNCLRKSAETEEAISVVLGACYGVLVVVLTTAPWLPTGLHSYGLIRGNLIAPLMIRLPIGALLGGLAGFLWNLLFPPPLPSIPAEIDLNLYRPAAEQADENEDQIY